MKKTIFVILIVTILALALTACNDQTSGETYNSINEMLKDEFSMVKLQVETTDKGITLTNKYTAMIASNGTMVTYSVQSLAEIVENQDGTFTMPANMIVTENGSASVNNGNIIDLNGKAENIPVDAITTPSLKFDKNYFAGTIHSDNDGVKTITGSVLDERVKDFTGNQNFDGKNMTFEVVYNETVESITLNYTMNGGATVKVTYTFSK